MTLDVFSKRVEKSIIDGEILKLQNSNKADSKESIDRLQNADVVNQEDEHNGHDLKSEKESEFKQATKLVAENAADQKNQADWKSEQETKGKMLYKSQSK